MSIRDVLLQITALPIVNCSASSSSEADWRREAGCMKWNRRFAVLCSCIVKYAAIGTAHSVSAIYG